MKKNTTLLLIFSSFFVLFITSFANAAEWYEGGNLHKATVRMWRKASYDNRLATSGDWFNKITKKSNPDLQKKLDGIEKSLGTEIWLLTLKQFSEKLEKCVSDTAADEKVCKPSDKVAEIASICYNSMYMTQEK